MIPQLTVPAAGLPPIGYFQLAPVLIVLGAATLGVLLEAFLPRASRYPVQMVVTLGSLLAAFVAVVLVAFDPEVAAGGPNREWDPTLFRGVLAAAGSVAIDGPALFLQGTVLLLAAAAVLTIGERRLDAGGAFTPQAAAVPGSEEERRVSVEGMTQTEVFPLLLFSVAGMMLFPAANDLLTFFIALELLSFPVYVMCGLARRRRLLSQESAMKYFLLGSFSSAFLLYGIALLYGFAGSMDFGAIAVAVSAFPRNDTLLLMGTGLILVGLLFKVSAVPFHVWTPDVYVGAPTPVTGFMAACTKVAAFGALVRILYVALGGAQWDWKPLLWVVAILTMIGGAVLALTQTDVKRMLAYSSIAHAGFLLVGVIATNNTGVAGVLFYLLAYGFITIGAFAVLTLVRTPAGEATHLSQWAGLGRRSPILAGIFTLFLLAFAGLPPTSGFIGKFGVFRAAVEAGDTPLVVVGLVSSAIAAFFYARVIVLMFFSAPAPDAPTVAMPSVLTTIAVTAGVSVTVLLGVAPQPFLQMANEAAGCKVPGAACSPAFLR